MCRHSRTSDIVHDRTHQRVVSSSQALQDNNLAPRGTVARQHMKGNKLATAAFTLYKTTPSIRSTQAQLKQHNQQERHDAYDTPTLPSRLDCSSQASSSACRPVTCTCHIASSNRVLLDLVSNALLRRMQCCHHFNTTGTTSISSSTTANTANTTNRLHMNPHNSPRGPTALPPAGCSAHRPSNHCRPKETKTGTCRSPMRQVDIVHQSCRRGKQHMPEA